MSLETFTDYAPDELNTAYPGDTDSMHEGAAHIRNVKNVIKTTFANVTGAVTATHTELNYIVGMTQSISTAISGTLGAPTGTKMVFYQDTAPTGWTLDTTVDNAMLRVVNDVTTTWVTGVQGTDSPILMDKVPSHTHTFTSDSHTHNAQFYDSNYGQAAAGSGSFNFLRYIGGGQVATTGSTVTGTTNANGSASNWAPKYINVMVASKD